jgi:PPOX class probable F420-dependent enzyme
VDIVSAMARLAEARVARLATITPEGRPHIVPCCFMLHQDMVYTGIDAKPKSTLALRRLDNLRANPTAALLVDHYEDDWLALWWVRVDGSGRIVSDGEERRHALEQLRAKYEQYGHVDIAGEVIALDIERITSWP